MISVPRFSQDVQGARFTAFVAFRIILAGTETYCLADGFQRVDAALLAGLDEIDVDVRNGGLREAVLYSVGANAMHGLRRTNEDKRSAVMTLLNDEEWSQWSDREIARKCAVGPDMVGRLRAELNPPSVGERQMGTSRTVQRGGRVYEQNVTRIGKAAKPGEPPREAGDPPLNTIIPRSAIGS